MDGIGMKRLLIRLSAASGVVVTALVAIAVAKYFGWGKAPAGTASAKETPPAAQAMAEGAKAVTKAASKSDSAPTEMPLKDPFQPAVGAPAARYEPQDYYAEDQAAAPVATGEESPQNSAADLMESAGAALNATQESAAGQETYADQEGTGSEATTEQADPYAPQPSAFDQAPTTVASQEFDQQQPEAAADKSAAPEREEHYVPPTSTIAEEPVAETNSAWPESDTASETMSPVAESDSGAPHRLEPQAPAEEQPRPLPRDQAERNAVANQDDYYLDEQFPAAHEQEHAEAAAPVRETPVAAKHAPVRGAAEGAGVPGDPKLEAEQGAALVIHKTGPPEVQLGLETLYEIRVQNVGDAPAHGVEVHDVAPRGADLIATQPQVAPGPNGELVWALGTLNPGEETTVEMRVIPRTEGEIGSVARVLFSAEAAARTLVTKPVLELSVEAPKSVLAGERAQLFVRVTNTGTGVATGVVLEEIVPAGFEHPAGATLEYRVGTLKPRDSRELPLTLSAKKPMESSNVVTARADGDILVEQRTPLAIVAPALQVEMQGPRRRFLDRDATYTVAVKNPGTAPAHEIELVTFLAEGMEFVSADSAGQYDPQTRAVYWLLDELPPNEMGSVTVTARPTKPGEHVLRVEGRAQRGLEAIEEQPILVEGLAAVEFQVIDLADPVEINGEAAYEIIVKNGGTKDSSQIELVAMLPVEMQLISAEGPTRFKAAGQKVMFEPLKSLAPGESVSYQLTAKTVDAGDARLQVKLITAEMQSPVTKEENTKVFGDE